MDTNEYVDYRVADWIRRHRLPRTLTIEEGRAANQVMSFAAPKIRNRKTLDTLFSGAIAAIITDDPQQTTTTIKRTIISPEHKGWALGAILGLYALRRQRHHNESDDTTVEYISKQYDIPVSLIDNALGMFTRKQGR
jgi:hypothetical protein